MNKPEYITNIDWKLLQEKYPNLNEIEDKLNKQYPVQYLIGNVSFYGYNFLVNENVLIPRFETETFVEKIIKYIKKLNLTNTTAIDLGTGSGIIAITLKKELKNLTITALDNSKEALTTAIQNAKLNNTQIKFLKEDILQTTIFNNYNIIISNPPYIPENSNYDKKILFEPKQAIFVKDNNPLIYYETIIKQINPTNVKLICFEIDEDFGKEIINLSNKYLPNYKIIIEKDLCYKDRYAFIYTE